jgi:predicted transcriptional regulator
MSADALDALLAEAKAPTAFIPPRPAPDKPAVAKLRYTHEAMVDQIIANPGISQNDLGALFGYSASWVSRILSSDAFQAKLAERSEQLIDPAIRSSVEDRFKGMVLRSMEILAEKLDRPSKEVPDQLVLRSLELSSRALGYGAKKEEAPQQTVNLSVHLENLGEGLVELLKRKKTQAIEASTEP